MGVSSGPSESDLSKSSGTRAPATRQSIFPFVPPGCPSTMGDSALQEGGSHQIPAGSQCCGFGGGGKQGEAGGPTAELGTDWFLPCHQLTPKISFASFNPISSWGQDSHSLHYLTKPFEEGLLIKSGGG